MDLHEALEIVLELATDNVIDDKMVADMGGDTAEEQDIQNQACELVQKLLDINSQEKLAAECGEAMILECNLKKKKNGRVDLRSGDKTPIGMTRTMFRIFSNHARGNV